MNCYHASISYSISRDLVEAGRVTRYLIPSADIEQLASSQSDHDMTLMNLKKFPTLVRDRPSLGIWQFVVFYLKLILRLYKYDNRLAEITVPTKDIYKQDAMINQLMKRYPAEIITSTMSQKDYNVIMKQHIKVWMTHSFSTGPPVKNVGLLIIKL